MILIIKSTHSLSTILTDRSSGWWATPNPSPFSLTLNPNDQNTIHTQSWQWIQSIQKRRIHDGTLFWSYRSTLSIIILNTVKWFQYSISHYSICLTHPSHTLSCYEGQVAIRFNPYESLSYQHSSLLSSLWLWDITILFHYPLINPYTWILNSVW